MVMANYFGWCSNISQTSIRSYSFWCFSSTLYGTDRGRGQVYWGAMKSGRGRGSPVRYWATVVEWTWSHLLPWLHLEWRWLEPGATQTLVVRLRGGFEGSLMVSCRALLAVMTSNDRSQMALGGQFHCSKAEQVSVIHMHICLVQWKIVSVSCLYSFLEQGKGEHFLLLHVFLL